MDDDHFLKRMFGGEDWGKKAYYYLVNAFGILVLIILGLITWGFFEWYNGYDILQHTQVAGQKAPERASDQLNNLGSYGSFLQGTTQSLWTLAGCIAAILAFGFQAYQLLEQRKQFKIQTESVTRQDFESRFFGLLEFHRQNVSEIGIDEKTGRRVFVSLIREFRCVFDAVNRVCDTTNPQYPKSKRLKLAYLAFYYGVGPNSTRILKEVADSNAPLLVDGLVTELALIQTFARTTEADRVAKFGTEFGRLNNIYSEIRERLSYIPFDGHQSRLGHYYRHMFQLVAYLDQQATTATQKEYADIFRAQLTNHEQALLCLNALSSLGNPWVTRGYLVNYELIRNIPKSFFDPEKELDVKAEFPQITFEYERANDPARDTNP